MAVAEANAPTQATRQPTIFVGPVPMYLASFLVIGMSLTLLGPALTDLRQRSGSDVGGVAILFVGQSLGYFLGAQLSGRLYDRLNGHRLFAASLLVIGAGLVSITAVNSIPAWFVGFMVIGAGAGSTDLGANAQLLWVLGADSTRAMATLHFCFGIGALASPLMVYLGVTVAVWCGAALCVALAVWAIRIPAPRPVLDNRGDQTDATTPVLAIISVFFMLYVGVELGFSGLLKSYGDEVELSDWSATWLVTTFWVSFTIGRLATSVIGGRAAPRTILVNSCVLTMVAAAVLAIGGGRTGPLWIGVVLMGVGTAAQFPVMLSHLERRMRVTGRAAAWFVGAAGLGGLIFPYPLGRWMDWAGPTAMLWAVFGLSAATTASFYLADRTLNR